MTLARYFVFQQDDTWIIGFEGRVMAHFPSKTDALDSARGMANLMGAMHYDADVMLDEGGLLQQIWVYSRDQPAPPPKRKRRHDSPAIDVLPHDRSLIVLVDAA